MSATILHGECIAEMSVMPEASIDAIVTDPPYGLGFMGKKWDDLPPGEEWARECLRVLKPGGHLLAFGGTRTWHRLAVAVEDAGFELRDSIAWMYGSGFPKSLDVSKAIDKLDAADERRARALMFTAWMRSTGIHSAQINDITGTNMGNHYLTDKEQPAVATADLFDKLRPYLPPVPDDIEELVRMRTVESQNLKARAVIGERTTGISTGRGTVAFIGDSDNRDVTAPATNDARKWEGWGTALKPAFEPIIVARKPLQGTVAANVLRHGTGALNIDGCRLHAADVPAGRTRSSYELRDSKNEQPAGRWPTNVILDDDQAAALDAQSGTLKSGALTPYKERHENASSYSFDREKTYVKAADQGGASRFFYCAKAPKNERPVVDGVAHPTVKPLSLMRWLTRLATPPGGTVLDPFAGSGTTIEAAILEGFDAIGIEREAEYLPLIRERLARVAA